MRCGSAVSAASTASAISCSSWLTEKMSTSCWVRVTTSADRSRWAMAPIQASGRPAADDQARGDLDGHLGRVGVRHARRERLLGDQRLVGARGGERRGRAGERQRDAVGDLRGRRPCGPAGPRGRGRGRCPRPRARASPRCRGRRSRRAAARRSRCRPARSPATVSRAYSPSTSASPPAVTVPSSATDQSPVFEPLIASWTSLPSRGPAARALTVSRCSTPYDAASGASSVEHGRPALRLSSSATSCVEAGEVGASGTTTVSDGSGRRLRRLAALRSAEPAEQTSRTVSIDATSVVVGGQVVRPSASR